MVRFHSSAKALWIARITRALLPIVVSLLPTLAYATPSIRIEVTPTTGSVDDLFLYTVTIEGAARTGAPLLTGGSDFTLELLGSQTAVSIGSNGVDPKASYFYNLKPRREGELLTPGVEVDLGGQTLRAAPQKVVIRPIQRAGPPDAAAGTIAHDETLYARQSAVPVAVYQGQQVINTISLYTQHDLPEFVIDDLNSDGFWQEPLVDDDRSTKVINGAQYMVVQVKKALFALRSGNVSIPARKVKAKVPVRRRGRPRSPFGFFDDDIFGGIFGTIEIKDVELLSNASSVDVTPLPPVPPEMQGALTSVPIVGSTKIELSYPPDAINVGESKTVTVSVVSTGNLKPLKSLPLLPPSGVKVYDERPEGRSDRRGQQLISYQTFRYSVVPLRPGLIRVPGIQLAYFDPSKKTYALSKTADIAFPVRGTAITDVDTSVTPDSSATPAAAASGTNSPTLLPTLPPIPRAPPLEYNEPTLLEELSQQVSLALALLIASAVAALILIVILATRLRSHRTGDVRITPTELEQSRSTKDLERLVRRLVASRLSDVREDSSLDQIRAVVRVQVPDRDTALALCSVLDDLEVLQYGGSSEGSGEELTALRARIREVQKRF